MNNKLDIFLNRKGFIAALDQSGGSSKKTLANYGVMENEYQTEEAMFDKIQEMRKRIITSDVFNKDTVLGVILFENTMERQINGQYVADYLWEEKEILSFLKIDKGLDAEVNGVQLLKEIPDLDRILDLANTRNIFGTKMRSVINEVNEEGIKLLVEQQFQLAKIIASKGLIPIIEPEVNIYAIEKFGCEQILLKYVKEELNKLDKDIKVIFKFTLPEMANFYDELYEYEQVIKIVALSGGYSKEKANQLLKENKRMIASFSRALLEDLKVFQNEQEFNFQLQKNLTSIYDASINK